MSAKKETEKSSRSSVFDHSDILTSKAGQSYVNKKNVIICWAALTALVVFGIGLYYFIQYRHAQNLLKNPLLASEMQQETIVKNVGKLTQVPSGEQPAIAKVSDITKLNNQPFFQNAKNGDFVLIYPKAKEAILYDPDANKVLRVGPILVPSPTAGTPQTALGAQTSNLPVTVALYNGTTISGLTKKIQQELITKMPSATVVMNQNASKQDYTKTIVIDVSGTHTAAAAQLAQLLNGTVASMPSGELKPVNADLLVILGSHIFFK